MSRFAEPQDPVFRALNTSLEALLKDGKIYRMSEVCPQDFEEFWDATGLDE